MRAHQIENWVLEIIERVNNNQPIEDFRVELKADWPPAERAARRIAGHANAARGNPILWLIGVDETKGVVGAKREELSTWFPQVKSCFDGLAPQMVDLNIPMKGKTVVALHFETDRVTFVVKNPKFGTSDGGPVEWEVPWREGTTVRSATHSDLIRILSPLQELPHFEPMHGNLVGKKHKGEPGLIYWYLDVTLYVTPPNDYRIVIPFHKCYANGLFSNSIGWISFDDLKLNPPFLVGIGGPGRDLSKTIESTQDEVIIYGPGKAKLRGKVSTKPPEDVNDTIQISISAMSTNAEYPLIIDITLHKKHPEEDEVFRWSFPD